MTTTYPVTFNVDYPDRDLDRLTSAFRIVVAIPILAVLSLLTGASLHYVTTNNTTNETATLATGGGVLFLPLVLMIVFRQKYPRWWFDWNLQVLRLSARVSAYLALLDDRLGHAGDDDGARHPLMVEPPCKPRHPARVVLTVAAQLTSCLPRSRTPHSCELAPHQLGQGGRQQLVVIQHLGSPNFLAQLAGLLARF